MARYRVAVLLAVCLTAGSLLAASPEDRKQSAKKSQAEETQALEALTIRFGFNKPLAVVGHAGGAVSIGLDGRYDHTYVVTTDENGNLVFACIDNPVLAYAATTSAGKSDTILRLQPEKKPAPEKE